MGILGTYTPVLDNVSGIVGEIVDIGKSLLALCTEFPLNIFLGSAVAGIAFTLIRRAKRTVV